MNMNLIICIYKKTQKSNHISYWIKLVRKNEYEPHHGHLPCPCPSHETYGPRHLVHSLPQQPVTAAIRRVVLAWSHGVQVLAFLQGEERKTLLNWIPNNLRFGVRNNRLMSISIHTIIEIFLPQIFDLITTGRHCTQLV